MRPDDPLDRPVRWGKSLEDWARPSDVLAALDDEQRLALAEIVGDVLMEVASEEAHERLTTSVVAALCDREESPDA